MVARLDLVLAVSAILDPRPTSYAHKYVQDGRLRELLPTYEKQLKLLAKPRSFLFSKIHIKMRCKFDRFFLHVSLVLVFELFSVRFPFCNADDF